MEEYDLAIVGGGINGCGIARDAAGRGLSTLLVEQSDLASATSSASSKMIHGGLRYLEHYAFRLVRESLQEREILMNLAPHIVSPLRLVIPHVGRMRPTWMIRLGLSLYDYLAGSTRRTLPRSRKISLKDSPLGAPLKGIDAAIGFEYYDCWVDDARLVILNARDAAQRGAEIRTRTRCVHAAAKDGWWHLQLTNTPSEVRAKCLINATGPWAAAFLQQISVPKVSRPSLRLVQGSHIIVPALYEGEHAYLLQNDDGRVIFAIPYEKKFTMIGTTDRDFHGDPKDAFVSDEETEYLQNAIERYFGVIPSEIISRFCGVRPLVAGEGLAAQKANRDYLIELESVCNAPLLNIYGGKLTTYRRLAENALNKIASTKIFPSMKSAWSATSPLPGGDLPETGISGIARTLTENNSRITPAHAERLARAYGSMATDIPPPETVTNKWRNFGADLFSWEVDYLMREEWAVEADDVLWRRSSLGMCFSPQQREDLADYMQEKIAHA